MKCTMIACTNEVGNIAPENDTLVLKAKILAGKAAGVCYMKDDYTSKGINDAEKCLKRAQMTAKSGHYSTYEHFHITLLLEGISKAVAMFLNSMRTYNTSEKSARYTKMNPESKHELELYNKWTEKFKELIKAYDSTMSDADTEKIAMENARYMISVFTPTTMIYTVPYNRLVMMLGWMDKFGEAYYEDIAYNTAFQKYEDFYTKLQVELKLLKVAIMEELCIKDDDLLPDHKNMPIELFGNYDPVENKITSKRTAQIRTTEEKDYCSDVYRINYNASLASIAQLQRHRRTVYTIVPHYTGFGIEENEVYYIPELIVDSPLEKEWLEDIASVDVPQGLIFDVIERGITEDFILKCKERLCYRAQLETSLITSLAATRMWKIMKKWTPQYIKDQLLECTGGSKRCEMKNYSCKEACLHCKDNLCLRKW